MEEKKLSLRNFIPDKILDVKVVNQQYLGDVETNLFPGIINRELALIGYENIDSLRIVEILFDDGNTGIWLIIDDIEIDDRLYTVFYNGFDQFGYYDYKKKKIYLYNFRGKF